MVFNLPSSPEIFHKHVCILSALSCFQTSAFYHFSLGFSLSEVSPAETQWVLDLERALGSGNICFLLFLMSREVSGTHSHSFLIDNSLLIEQSPQKKHRRFLTWLSVQHQMLISVHEDQETFVLGEPDVHTQTRVHTRTHTHTYAALPSEP